MRRLQRKQAKIIVAGQQPSAREVSRHLLLFALVVLALLSLVFAQSAP
jgi:hypothetical protein